MRSKSLLFTAALLLIPITAGAQALPTQAVSRHHGDKFRGMFTPEQRVMLMRGARDQVRDMTPDQRHAWRHDQMMKIRAMSDSERASFTSGLQAQWEALPQKRKDRIEQRIAAREQGKMSPAMDHNPNAVTR